MREQRPALDERAPRERHSRLAGPGVPRRLRQRPGRGADVQQIQPEQFRVTVPAMRDEARLRSPAMRQSSASIQRPRPVDPRIELVDQPRHLRIAQARLKPRSGVTPSRRYAESHDTTGPRQQESFSPRKFFSAVGGLPSPRCRSGFTPRPKVTSSVRSRREAAPTSGEPNAGPPTLRRSRGLALRPPSWAGPRARRGVYAPSR